MKKILSLALLGVMLSLIYTTPILAAEDINLYIDDNKVMTESYTYTGKTGAVEGKYYMDILPQVKNERTYVAISTIIKFLGAHISWQNPIVTIRYNNTTLILTIGETEAIQNGKSIKLDAPPYLDRGRTMIPLRFISEAFGLNVNYKDNRVDVNFPKLKVNDITIKAIRSQYWMTMGSVISESKNNSCMSRIYDVFNTVKTKEIAEPSLFGKNYNIDIPEFYILLGEYCFINDTNNVVEQYEIYSELSFGMSTGIYILRDVKNSKWYSFSEEEYYHIIDLENIGKWDIISNTVV